MRVMDRLFVQVVQTRWLVGICPTSFLAWAAVAFGLIVQASMVGASDRNTSVRRLPSMVDEGIRPYQYLPAHRDLPATRPAVRPVTRRTDPIPEVLPARTADHREMAIISERADRHVRYGLGMASRGGSFTARAEFIRALRLIAEALDAQPGNGDHAGALARGLRALDEAEDFMPTGARLEADIDMPTVLAGHRTQLNGPQPSTLNSRPLLTPRAALDQYYQVAYQQLGHACGHVVVGSAALYGLGKIETTLSESRLNERPVREYRAMVMHQAALQVDPRNPLAANELGVLLARYGRLGPARRLLEQSVQLLPRRIVWHNLSVVYLRSGEAELATQARGQLAKFASKSAPVHGQPDVQWLDNGAFARTAGPVSSSNRLTK